MGKMKDFDLHIKRIRELCKSENIDTLIISYKDNNEP